MVGDEYFPITYNFDADADNAKLTWFVSALVIQFSIQKHFQLKNAVLEHLIVTVNETKPIPEYRPMMGLYPSEANLFYVQIGPNTGTCLLYTSPSPRDKRQSRMPSSA